MEVECVIIFGINWTDATIICLTIFLCLVEDVGKGKTCNHAGPTWYFQQSTSYVFFANMISSVLLSGDLLTKKFLNFLFY